MEYQILEKRIAHLEFQNEAIVSELRYVDQLLRILGFPEGMETIKAAAQEVIEEEDATEE